ncbi:hypothetical protein [Ensifer adhaerens]|uniref:Uncharacterized protein n=1 Tax=Ensifer adhaerens TaxID=106592 RepID=A0ABY8HC48_ENSAD|nr:hypothetical protein [Ensifer adhaerens]WFP89673.1 hypothetical protein P4B07_14025 [Ensifer adhaerens]
MTDKRYEEKSYTPRTTDIKNPDVGGNYTPTTNETPAPKPPGK